jgi:hypothetical protein
MGTGIWEPASSTGRPGSGLFPHYRSLAAPPPLTAAVMREPVPGRRRPLSRPSCAVSYGSRYLHNSRSMPILSVGRIRVTTSHALIGARIPRGGAMPS